MPLIIISGMPCSGKTKRTHELNNYFKNAAVVCDSNIGFDFDKNSSYLDTKKEKVLRSAIKSEILKYLSKNTVVIVDAANYIKGYRYELYCLGKASKTTYCVVHCDLSNEDCFDFNRKRSEDEQYTKEIFDDLGKRFECPNSENKWDSPLFTVHRDEALPFEKISEALLVEQDVRPNMSTQKLPLATSDALHDLDGETLFLVKDILKLQKTCSIGDYIELSGVQDKIKFTKALSSSEMAKIRQDFIMHSRTGAFDGSNIKETFIRYMMNCILETV